MSLFLWKALSIFNAMNTTGSTPAYPAWHTPGCGLQADLALQFSSKSGINFPTQWNSQKLSWYWSHVIGILCFVLFPALPNNLTALSAAALKYSELYFAVNKWKCKYNNQSNSQFKGHFNASKSRWLGRFPLLTPANIGIIGFKYLGVGFKKIFMDRSGYGVTVRTFKCAKCHVEYHPAQNMEFSLCKEHPEHSHSSVEVNPCSSLRGFRVMFWYWMKFHQFNLKANKEVSLITLQVNVFLFWYRFGVFFLFFFFFSK